ncbi:hypothetical protein AMTR_s00018p00244670 [Amborella trichopoda]|uniref:Uncharacterized protein n=1 Tax=Amborella trichopoda TaxID=13333 RepID=W1PJR7_AMBTC|nr:hypothetical protein AMTR_s00018p00244670 [Amborella trichopoda]
MVKKKREEGGGRKERKSGVSQPLVGAERETGRRRGKGAVEKTERWREREMEIAYGKGGSAELREHDIGRGLGRQWLCTAWCNTARQAGDGREGVGRVEGHGSVCTSWVGREKARVWACSTRRKRKQVSRRSRRGERRHVCGRARRGRESTMCGVGGAREGTCVFWLRITEGVGGREGA